MPIMYLDKSQQKTMIFIGCGILIIILGVAAFFHFLDTWNSTPKKIEASKFSEIPQEQRIIIEGYIVYPKNSNFHFAVGDEDSVTNGKNSTATVPILGAGSVELDEAIKKHKRVRVQGIRRFDYIDGEATFPLLIKDATTDERIYP